MVERPEPKRKFPLWVFLLLGGVGVGAFAWYTTLQDARAKQELESALLEVAALTAESASGPGGAEADYQIAFDAYFAELDALRINLPSPEDPVARTYLDEAEKRKKILPTILRACEKPSCVFATSPPRLEEGSFESEFYDHPEERLYEFAIWTNREARVASLENDWPRCRRYLRATAQLSRHAGQQSGLDAAYASSKIDRGLITTVELILDDHRKSLAWLRDLDAFVESLAPAYSYRRAAAVELARARALLHRMIDEDRFDLVAEGPTTDDASFTSQVSRTSTRTRWEAGLVRRFKRAYEALPTDPEDVRGAIRAWKAAFATSDPFEAMFLSRFMRDAADVFKRLPTTPRHQIMRAVLAFERFRLGKGMDPASTGVLGDVAKDPYGPEHLRVLVISEPMVRVKEITLPNGLIQREESPLPTDQVRKLLYSVGQNGRDDKGLGDDVYVFLPGIEVVKR